MGQKERCICYLREIALLGSSHNIFVHVYAITCTTTYTRCLSHIYPESVSIIIDYRSLPIIDHCRLSIIQWKITSLHIIVVKNKHIRKYILLFYFSVPHTIDLQKWLTNYILGIIIYSVCEFYLHISRRTYRVRHPVYLHIWQPVTVLFLAALMPLINMITNDWLKAKVKEERDVMLRQAKISRIFTTCGELMILSTLIFGLILPCFGLTIRHVTNLTDPGKPLPIQTYYLHDVSKSPQFELTLLMQGIGLTLSGLTYTGVDTFLGLLVLHICGQMKNLHVRLANLGEKTDYRVALKYNVKDHVRLIRFPSWIPKNTLHSGVTATDLALERPR